MTMDLSAVECYQRFCRKSILLETFAKCSRIEQRRNIPASIPPPNTRSPPVESTPLSYVRPTFFGWMADDLIGLPRSSKPCLSFVRAVAKSDDAEAARLAADALGASDNDRPLVL
jgi:hypothetical protein